jgi:hypothetical protein
MNTSRTKLIAAALAAALAILPAAEASARGGFRGGGFSSRSFSTRSFRTTRPLAAPRSGSWGSATRPKAAAGLPSGAAGAASAGAETSRGGISGGRASASQRRGLYDSAKRNGTLFSTRQEAAQSFRSRYAKDYSSSFPAEPATRPSYIPGSTVVSGRNVNVFYNPAMGGYGYIHPLLGTWILFDALGDAAMLDYAMSNRGYYWGGAPVYQTHGPGFLGIAFAILVFILVASLISRVGRRFADGYRRDDERRYR